MNVTPRGALGAAALLIMLFVQPAAAPSETPSAVDRDLIRTNGLPQSAPAPERETTGGEAYAVHCSSCHGASLNGSTRGPSLQNAGGARVDFYVRTGRMPLAGPPVQAWHTANRFDPETTAALIAYVDAHVRSSIPIPTVHIDPKLLQRGRIVFEENCQACHGVAGQGATAGSGWIAVPLKEAASREVGEAVRIGPGVMPVFPPALISDRDLDAVATYVDYINTRLANPGGSPFDYLGPTAEGAIAIAIGIGGLFAVIFLTGTTTRGARSNRSR